MNPPLRPIPESRPIRPLGPRAVRAFPITSYDPRADMRQQGALEPVLEVLTPRRRAEVSFSERHLAPLLRWDVDGAFYNIFMNPKEMYEEALRLNDATQAMILGQADDLTPWRILASPRIEQVMDTDTALAHCWIDATEPGPVSLGRALRAAEDFRADNNAAYHLVTAFRSAVARTLFGRPGGGSPFGDGEKRPVDLGDITPLLLIPDRVTNVPREWLAQSALRDAYRSSWGLLSAPGNRGRVRMEEASRRRLEQLADGAF
ncbi:MAG: hypothetical protein RLY93_06115 [Sumerlaeia bacterium]